MPEHDHAPPALSPSMATVYRPVEDYLDRLGVAAEPTAVPLAPVDALLVRLASRYQPAAPVLIDLAADLTGGATTALCLTDPVARRTVIRPAARRPWRFVIDQYLEDNGHPPGGLLEVDVAPGRTAAAAGPHVPRVVLTARGERTGAELAEEVEAWLAAEPNAVVVVLDAGPVGSCPALAALLPRVAASSWHLTLARDLSPALAGSRAVIVGRRSNPVVGTLTFRIGRLFNDHLRYLELVNERCLTAVRDASAADPTFAHRLPPGAAEAARDVKDAADSPALVTLRQQLAAREQEVAALHGILHELHTSRAFRMLLKVRGDARRLARSVPGARWVVRKARGLRRRLRR